MSAAAVAVLVGLAALVFAVVGLVRRPMVAPVEVDERMAERARWAAVRATMKHGGER